MEWMDGASDARLAGVPRPHRFRRFAWRAIGMMAIGGSLYGCVRIGTLNDLNAEWTGGIFDATGERFFVSVQHNVTGHGVILEITGWQRGDRDDDGEGDHGR